jgi:hypothetical protein
VKSTAFQPKSQIGVPVAMLPSPAILMRADAMQMQPSALMNFRAFSPTLTLCGAKGRA